MHATHRTHTRTRALTGWLHDARRAVAALGLAGAGILAAAAPAGADSCRDWQGEHDRWKSEAVRRYLDGSPQERIDAAIFEMLQREAYLTSCELPMRRARTDLVGWRLVDRPADEYGRAVVESLLEASGLPLDVRSWFEPALSSPAPAPVDAARGGSPARRW